MFNKFNETLQKSSIRKCSDWAEAYRVMKKPFDGPWTFKYHPWLLEMHDAPQDFLVGKKAAQLGYSEWVINLSFFNLDVCKEDVLYVLPTTQDASNFSSTRFDPSLDLSPYIKDLFDNVNNVSLKKSGTNSLYIRGSRSRSQLKSLPASLLIFDELDEMPKGMLELGEYRASGQLKYRIICLSTPTIKGEGIDLQFELSTQDYYYFKCPSCSRSIRLICPEKLDDLSSCSLVLCGESPTDVRIKESYFRCTECNAKLNHEDKSIFLAPKGKGGTGKFVSTYSDRDARGFHVNQMYSSARAGRPEEFAKKIHLARINDTVAQEVYNSKFGECYEAKGARVQESDILKCIGSYQKGTSTADNTIITMGIDVGSVLHIVIKEFYDFKYTAGICINFICRSRLLLETMSTGSFDDFTEAYDLFKKYKVHKCVVDAEPERRAALQFAQSIWGHIYLCDYQQAQKGRQLTVNEDELAVKVNRTSWLDISQGRYKKGTIDLPYNVSEVFKSQIKEPLRIYKYDKDENPYAIFISVGADHFAHADTYAEIALPIATKNYENEDIK